MKLLTEEEQEKELSLAETEPFNKRIPILEKMQIFENVETRDPNNIEIPEVEEKETLKANPDDLITEDYGSLDDEFEVDNSKNIKLQYNIKKKECPDIPAEDMKNQILKGKDGFHYISLKNKKNKYFWFIMK
jgi:hypothetical protein